jgi:hypothetical protein
MENIRCILDINNIGRQFRVRLDNNDIPTVALFEADGGDWRNQATENVVQYIQSLVNYISVIA